MADNPLVERPRPGVLRITIYDPERRNPLSSDLFWKIESTLRDDALWQELDALPAEAHGSDDVREGLSAFFERREPNFRGP
ncbi:MAG TPA: hypothetical protein VGR61_08930 [Candidatus Dormibacteraeota bacterium]|nr:hypothetical protein [Candidatus Dormibacteraeota bacterium]